MEETIKVGMADMKMCKAPNKLTTLGLGSCVGIALYDPVTQICGMIHIMLPDSTKIKNNSNIAKFADTGIAAMFEMMVRNGASAARITAKIAGGARMFSYGAENNDLMNVGERNVEATKKALEKLNIKIVAEDTGLNYGRTIVFDSLNGNLLIKAVGKPEKVI